MGQPAESQPNTKTIAAFFDVDGTLFTGHVWRGMLEYFTMKRGWLPVRAFWYAHMPLYALRKMKLISEERFRGPWAANLTWLARGWTRPQLQSMYDWVAQTYVTPLRREDTIARLAEHNAQGHLTVLVSTGFTGLMEAIARSVGAQMAVGTDVAMKNGRCTGRILPPLVIGAEKAQETRRRLAAHGYDVDFDASYAYADSVTDMGLFEMVGNPCPVYPDAELAQVARQRAWPIYGRTQAGS
jgi:HAD superfamily hydrolase (TIGR01490 family)